MGNWTILGFLAFICHNPHLLFFTPLLRLPCPFSHLLASSSLHTSAYLGSPVGAILDPLRPNSDLIWCQPGGGMGSAAFCLKPLWLKSNVAQVPIDIMDSSYGHDTQGCVVLPAPEFMHVIHCMHAAAASAKMLELICFPCVGNYKGFIYQTMFRPYSDLPIWAQPGDQHTTKPSMEVQW